MLLPPPPPLLLLLRLRLRVSLCFLPSISLTFSYPLSTSDLILSLSLPRALHLRSLWTGPPGVRKETEATTRQVSSHFLFLSFTVISPSYSAPFFRPYISPTTLMDACRSTRDPPRRCPFERLCPRRENARRSSSFAEYLHLAGVCHFVDPEDDSSPYPQLFTVFTLI